MLGKELIAVARRYRAFLEVDDRECRFLAVSDREEPPLVGAAARFPDGMGRVAGLEEAVYANPLLLSDFGGFMVMPRGGRFMLVPGFVGDDAMTSELFRAQYPVDNDLPPADLLIDDWKDLGARIVYEVNNDELSFLRRTFGNPVVRHPLTMLARYFADRRSGGSGSRTLLNVEDERADVVVLGPAGLLCANSFHISSPMDAAYYALAVRQSLSLSSGEELILAGTTALRAALTPVLRRGVSFVMPAIEPPAVLAAPKGIRALPFALKVAPFANL